MLRKLLREFRRPEVLATINVGEQSSQVCVGGVHYRACYSVANSREIVLVDYSKVAHVLPEVDW
jgi:hypothetical protein